MSEKAFISTFIRAHILDSIEWRIDSKNEKAPRRRTTLQYPADDAVQTQALPSTTAHCDVLMVNRHHEANEPQRKLQKPQRSEEILLTHAWEGRPEVEEPADWQKMVPRRLAMNTHGCVNISDVSVEKSSGNEATLATVGTICYHLLDFVISD